MRSVVHRASVAQGVLCFFMLLYSSRMSNCGFSVSLCFEKFVHVFSLHCFTFAPCICFIPSFDVASLNENVFEEAFLFIRFVEFNGCMEQIYVVVHTVQVLP